MIADSVKQEIAARLRHAEQEHQVKVLLAVESGSRAWGFASAHSDYDARFIYLNQTAWYLSVGLEEQRDVIEYPIIDDMDINGWDLRKALRLFSKSNPSFIEWIQSPIVYQTYGSFHQQLLQLLPEIYACDKGIYHYRHMAKQNFQRHLKHEQVSLKRYLYVLRAIFAARWIEHLQEPPPIVFATLRNMLQNSPQVQAEIDYLLALKCSGEALQKSKPLPKIEDFIQQELQRFEQSKVALSETKPQTIEQLSQLFRQLLAQTWA